jgi:predicted O-methyltransferase YrrM
MATTTIEPGSSAPTFAGRVARKVWREMSRPIRRLSQPRVRSSRRISHCESETAGTATPYLTGTAATFAGFHPLQATVEPEATGFLQRLVRQSCQYPGPIIEIGTLLGVTTTNMALAKSPEQKIVTVDNYCWNPWALPPDVHAALAEQILQYLVATGHVEQIRTDKNDFFSSYRGGPPAMVFLDAVHDYEETKKDIQWSQRVGAKIIAGHDYCDEFAGVKQAVDEFGGPRELCASVWVL